MNDRISVTRPGEGARVAGLLVKVPSAETAGAYCVLELTLPPGGGAPNHLHRREDELMVVAEGTLTVSADGTDYEAPAGSVVRLPKTVAHAFRNGTDRPVRVVITAIPGGLDAYFAALGALGTGATAEQVADINRQYEIEF
jgi:quercetin dioxygenase-like cupin family protein